MITWMTVLICIGMSADVFAVSLGIGLSEKKITPLMLFKVGLWFGVFHGLMPLIGWSLGAEFSDFISDYSFYILFVIMLVLGIVLIKEALLDEDERTEFDLSFKRMLPLSILLSIDAAVLGVYFAVGETGNFEGSVLLGCTVFLATVIGMYLGNHIGERFGTIATIFGGCLLIFNSIWALLEGLEIL